MIASTKHRRKFVILQEEVVFLAFRIGHEGVLSLGYVFINRKNNRGIWFA